MIPLAEQVVTHLAPINQVERFGIRPEPQNFANIDLARHINILGNSLKPIAAPIGPKHPLHLRAKSLLDRRNHPFRIFVVFEGSYMFIEVARASRSDAQRMNLWTNKAVEIIEIHWTQR